MNNLNMGKKKGEFGKSWRAKNKHEEFGKSKNIVEKEGKAWIRLLLGEKKNQKYQGSIKKCRKQG